MMTDKRFIEVLNTILNRKTSYNNRYPYNVGYYDGISLSFDCWNLVKAIDWSNGTIADNWRIGNYAVYTPSASLGDWNGRQILAHCSDVSSDMTNVPVGAFLLYEGDSHAGVYYGNGKVCECTIGWGQNGVILSDIDSKGRSFFKGVQRGRWYKWGKLPFVEYADPYPTFKEGDKVTVVQGAKVYGSNSYFAQWIYEKPMTVLQQVGDRVVITYDGVVQGAVSANDLLPYEEPAQPIEPSEPETPEVPDKPVDPETPETPEDPVQPSEPDEPLVPDNGTNEQPEKTEKPHKGFIFHFVSIIVVPFKAIARFIKKIFTGK